MKEIYQLFESTSIEDIRKFLMIVIKQIEKLNKEEKDLRLVEVVKEAKKKSQELQEKYTIIEGVSFFPERIAPIALLVEEIINDAENGEDILQVLKFNLNNYFNHFEKAEDDDWHVEIKGLQHIVNALEFECNYFEFLQKQGIHLSIMMFHNRFRKFSMQVLNYSELKNENFAIHIFYYESDLENGKDIQEIYLEQFRIFIERDYCRKFAKSSRWIFRFIKKN